MGCTPYVLHTYKQGHSLGGGQVATRVQGPRDNKINIINVKIWPCALNNFKITEPNKSKFSNWLWLFKIHNFCYAYPLWFLTMHAKKNLAVPMHMRSCHKWITWVQQDNVNMNIALRHIHVTTVAMEKQNIYYILNDSLALCSTQCTCAILSSAVCLAISYFSTSHKMVRFLREKNYWT
jgi:hypothetical protein